MARNNQKQSSAMRNLRSAGWTAARFAGRTTEKAAVGLFRWASTDHSGLSRAIDNMPDMGFLDSVKYVLVHFLIAVAAALVGAVLIFVVVGYGIPFLLTLLL